MSHTLENADDFGQGILKSGQGKVREFYFMKFVGTLMKSIKVCEYSRSRSFHDDLILQDQASGERSQDQWSSGWHKRHKIEINRKLRKTYRESNRVGHIAMHRVFGESFHHY